MSSQLCTTRPSRWAWASSRPATARSTWTEATRSSSSTMAAMPAETTRRARPLSAATRSTSTTSTGVRSSWICPATPSSTRGASTATTAARELPSASSITYARPARSRAPTGAPSGRPRSVETTACCSCSVRSCATSGSMGEMTVCGFDSALLSSRFHNCLVMLMSPKGRKATRSISTPNDYRRGILEY